MNQKIKQAAQAFWQEDLAKFNPKMKEAPYEFERMFEGGIMWAISELKRPRAVPPTDDFLGVGEPIANGDWWAYQLEEKLR
jgi:hypothetical protein